MVRQGWWMVYGVVVGVWNGGDGCGCRFLGDGMHGLRWEIRVMVATALSFGRWNARVILGENGWDGGCLN